MIEMQGQDSERVPGWSKGAITQIKRLPEYRGQLGEYLGAVSGQTVLGALLGAACLKLASLYHPSLQTVSLTFQHLLFAVCLGAFIGLISKSIKLAAINTVIAANAASARLNAKRAKKWCDRLSQKATQRGEERILDEAKKMIAQIEGDQIEDIRSSDVLSEFFTENLDEISQSTLKKIQRRIHYFSDRALHGDLSALKKLAQLNNFQKNNKLEEMIDNIMDEEEMFIIRDRIDSLYDMWFYRGLRD